jgi:D-serine deaminase-like pyridoxal phosphate-dependent protein
MLSAAYNPCADKAQLVKAYVGKAVSELPMPALVVDLDFAASNAHDMLRSAQRLGFLFRAHVKTHKVHMPCSIWC